MPEIKGYNVSVNDDLKLYSIQSSWREGNSRVGHSAIVDKINKTLTLIMCNNCGYFNKTRPFEEYGFNEINRAIEYAKRHCANPLWYKSNAGRPKKKHL